jgi:RHS repeat-associated protein
MNKSGTAEQVISRPKGGGAIKGLGETFSPDLHTGTGNLSMPIAVPSGRGGFQPDVTLVYSSGQGNGPFGMGWSLSVPGVSRDTSHRVPAYDDERDVFLLSGAEPLVPMSSPATGTTRYRPRTEAQFARITHVKSAAEDFWEVRSRSGLKSRYGHAGELGHDTAVVRNPDVAERVFAWHLTETVDPFGNRIEYLYEREPAQEDGPHRWDQIYLKTIRYGDYRPAGDPQFLVTVDFVYEPRPDPFSTYKAAFEIRTTQRCTRIEISTHADASRLTRVNHLNYLDDIDRGAAPANGVSLLHSIVVEGVDGDSREEFPPLEFAYTGFDPARRTYRSMSAVSGSVPERSLAHPDFELADLFGCGLPDIVQIGDATRYWRNLGYGRFDVPRPVDGLPAGVRLGDPGIQLADFDGDGHVDLLISGAGFSGYLPLTVDGTLTTGRIVDYTAAPPFALSDPEIRLVDLDGDGITDALRTGTQLELYFHDREAGWTRVETRSRDDFDHFPDVFFSDPRVKLADMSGDGMQDIVFIGAGAVSYWPCLGYGRWGQRIAMRGRIDFPDGGIPGGIGFDPRRLLLGDVDGDGLADLIYVESGQVTVWLNHSGNGWSDPILIAGTPPISEIDAVRLTDMLGTGTDGVLWTYDLGTFSDGTYKFLDLCGGLKPYLLSECNNHTGARTLVEYEPSTRFYLDDQAQPQTRWPGRLPFPVQVVSRIETIDEISGGKLSTEYRYHQGYWDGEEREFRGFGMVEQIDSETFDRYHASGSHGTGTQGFTAVDTIHFSPPTLTRTWFHQGQVQDSTGTWHEPDPSAGFWSDDPSMLGREQRPGLSDIARSAALNAEPSQLRHALRALRGSVLRSELYALDDSPNRDRPYTVTESLYDIREVEPFEPGTAERLRVFLPFQRATRTTQWERSHEPLTQFTFTGDPDTYGLTTQQLAIAVPRGRDPRKAQSLPSGGYLSTYATTEYAQRDDAEVYIVDRVARSTSYEVLNDGKLGVFELRDAVLRGLGSLRVIAHSRTFYDGEAFVGLPPLQLGRFGAPVRSEAFVFTEDFLDALYDPNDPLHVGPRPAFLDSQGAAAWPTEYPDEFKSLLPALAGYVHYRDGDIPGSPGGYYVTTQSQRYDFHDPSRVPRGLLMATRDPLGAEAGIDYDTFDLLPVQTTNAVGLTTQARYDYRVLQASDITDPNDNTASFAFSPAGFLVAQFLTGKNGEGDSAHPSMRMEYDLLAFSERRQPASVRSIRRVHHDSETGVPADEREETIESVEYSDGLGRLLQTRSQAEDTLFGDPVFGQGVLPADQSAPLTPTVGRTRQPGDPDNVIVSGAQTYDNKGRVVEKYEPYFATGYDFIAPADSERGQKVTIFYDPRGRPIRILNPDGSERLVVFGVPVDLADPDVFAPTPWESYTYDANDNAGRTHAQAANGYRSHWNTPASIEVDALGRTIRAVARNGPAPDTDWYTTRSTYDIQGNLVAITDALGREALSYRFDLSQRRWRMDSIDAGRRDTVPDAAGNPVESRDSKGAIMLGAFDVLHRPIRMWARDAAAGPVTLRQHIAYGDAGERDQSAAERVTARAHNLLGHPVAHHDEAGLATVADVDFKGNVLDTTRRLIADAPILAVYEQAAADGWHIAPFQVDWQSVPGQTLAEREAELLEATAYQTTTSFDALNRVALHVFPLDVEGERRQLHPRYNRAGELEQVQLDDTIYVERIAYDAKGQRALIAYGNGVMTRYAYDPHTFRLARLRSEQYTRDDTTYQPLGEVLQEYGYDYDLAANILAIRDRTPASGIPNNPEAFTASDPIVGQLLISGNALDRRFTYDPIYRLLTATGRECDTLPDSPPWLDTPRCTDLTRTRAYTETYAYDAVGSMLRLAHQNKVGGFVRGFVIDPDSNRLRRMQVGAIPYDYVFEANGNMRSETTSRHFAWNHADLLTTFATQVDGAEPSVHAHYLYDATGQRLKKIIRRQGGGVEVIHYLHGAFEHQRWGGSSSSPGENTLIHVVDDRQRIAIVRLGPAHPADRGNAVQFHLADHLGSSSVVVDNSGSVTNREEFTPYGETSFGSFTRKRYRFTGNERDEESGMGHHGVRYFLTAQCRWASCDPAGPAQSPNLYCYCLDAPTQFTDPGGRQSSEPGGFAIDTDLSGKLDAREVYDQWSCAKPEAAANLLVSIPRSAFTQDGWIIREAVHGSLAPPQPSPLAINIAQSNNRVQYADGSLSPTVEEHDKLQDEANHPSRQIGRNLRTTVSTTAKVFFPEYVATYHILTAETPEDAVQGLVELTIAKLIPGPESAAESAPASTPLYRGMKPGDGGLPQLGPSAKTLGVRIKTRNIPGDIPVDEAGMVKPGTGGMSVNTSPTGMPEYRRPPAFGGTAKDLDMFCIQNCDLGAPLGHRPDPTLPGHGFLEPAYPMSLADYQAALAATLSRWGIVLP